MNLASRVKGFQACISHLDSEILNWTKKRPTKDEETNGDNGERRLLLGGRSMGSRAAVMAALDHITNIDAEAENAKDENKAVVVDLVLCSYPLQGPKAIRDQILLDLPSTANVLFIIGSRDAMCPLDLLAGVRKKMRAQSWLLVVEGMDHGMHGRGKEELGVRAGKAAAEWVRGELVVGKWVRPEWENGERVLQIDESMEGEV
jgi:predicted alpha/beta-hydrolase family hydrolase